MRLHLACCLVTAATVTVAACGNNTLPNTDDMSVPMDQTVVMDQTAPPDRTAPKPDFYKAPADFFDPADYGGVNCGTQTCGGTDVCCLGQVDGGFTQMCMASCPDGGATQMCDGPEDCGGGSPYCCATLAIGAGNPPACAIEGAVASCNSACDGVLPLSCNTTATFRLCHHEPDCADDQGGYNFCCELSQGGQSIRVCVNDLVKQFLSPPCF